MTREEAIKFLEETSFGGKLVGDKNLVAVCDLAISALREQEQRENVWHDAKDNPPKKSGLYYGKRDDTDSMYLCQYRDGVWTLDAYPETRMHVIKWAYYNAFVQEQEERRWIPLTERMPKLIPCRAGTAYSEAVNVLTSDRKVITAIWDGTDWIGPFRFWDAEGEEITHWTPVLLPMPEPPKEAF